MSAEAGGAVVNIDQRSKPGARGRKDADKQEAVIKMKELESRVVELEDLLRQATAAKDRYNDGVKVVAEKVGLLSSVVNKFVKARVGESFEDEKRKVEQLQLCFDEIGLVKGAK